MFERFTDRARRAVVLAQQEARLLNHNYIGTEHELLGLLSERDGVACEALESVGLSLDAARQEVEEIVGTGTTSRSGHVPFTPRAKKVLEMALREALQLRRNSIGTEHILLGLLREGEGVAVQILLKRGVALDELRDRTMRLVAQRSVSAGMQTAEVAGGGPAPSLRMQRTLLAPPSLGRVEPPPELARVIPIARHIELAGGRRLALISLEIWSGWLDLRLAVVGPGAAEPAAASFDAWQLSDDRGTAYRVDGASSAGDRHLRVYQVSFSPPPPAEAGALTLTLPPEGEGGAGEGIVVVVELA